LTLAAIAASGLLLFLFAMPETGPSSSEADGTPMLQEAVLAEASSPAPAE